MQLSHSVPAVFDDPNLVSVAGLVAVLGLAQRAGLGDLVAERLSPLFARGTPEGTGLPEITAPDPLPKACQQPTITVSDDADLKRRPEHYWLSDTWIAYTPDAPRTPDM